MAGSVPGLCNTCGVSAATINLHQQGLQFQDNQVFLSLSVCIYLLLVSFSLSSSQMKIKFKDQIFTLKKKHIKAMLGLHTHSFLNPLQNEALGKKRRIFLPIQQKQREDTSARYGTTESLWKGKRREYLPAVIYPYSPRLAFLPEGSKQQVIWNSQIEENI